jgi:uncharacterized membrane protein YGL010W
VESGVEAGERRFVGIGEEQGRRIGEQRLGSEEKETSAVDKMGDLFDLEKQFSFYGSYHSNKVNIIIHIFFVWPIFYTSLILWAYTPALAPLPLAASTLPLQEYMVLNWSFFQAAIYGLYYIALDKKAGSLGALICLGCWIGANAVAQSLPWSLSWKIVLASQVTCWFFQIFGHQKFERRAPALLDNLPQAFVMAPFFVLLECLQVFGYEPYPGFQEKVQKNVDAAIREFRSSKEKKAA